LLIGLSADGNLYAQALPGVTVFALGGGPLFVAATTTTLGRVSLHEAGLVSGIVNTFNQLGAAICVAVASTVAAAGLTSTPSIEGSPTPSPCSPSPPPWPRCSRSALYPPERHSDRRPPTRPLTRLGSHRPPQGHARPSVPISSYDPRGPEGFDVPIGTLGPPNHLGSCVQW
jgi:hypothetical protein